MPMVLERFDDPAYILSIKTSIYRIHGHGNRGGGRGVAKNSESFKTTTYRSVYSNKAKYAHSRQWILENKDILMYRIVSFAI